MGEPVYSASKNAVQTLVHTVRRQLAGDGIRVMSLAPGPVANPMQDLYDPAEIQRAVNERQSHVSSEDCAEAVLFMLSRPRHVTIRESGHFAADRPRLMSLVHTNRCSGDKSCRPPCANSRVL